MTDKEFKVLQQFDAHKQEPKYTKADIRIAIFCGLVVFYMIFQVIRGSL